MLEKNRRKTKYLSLFRVFFLFHFCRFFVYKTILAEMFPDFIFFWVKWKKILPKIFFGTFFFIAGRKKFFLQEKKMFCH